jgi:hypothetical protein
VEKKPIIVVTRLAEEKRKLLVLYQAFLHIRRKRFLLLLK